MRKRKKTLIFGIVLLFIFLGIGYAYLTTTLSINGVTDVDANNWDVYFDNVNVTTGSVTGEQEIEAPTITSDTEVEYHIRLKEPGEFYEFTIDAKNDGTIDAMIETITKKVNGGTTIPAYLNYTITYVDNLPVSENHLLAHESLETYKVRVEYRSDINPCYLPSTAQSLTLSFGVEYVQSNSNAYAVGDSTTVYSISNIESQEGSSIPSGITLYSTAAEVRAASSNSPLYLKHIINNRKIVESYVEFVVTPEMVSAHPEMTAGTYSVRGVGSPHSPYNIAILNEAFDASNCFDSSVYFCAISGLAVGVDYDGNVYAYNDDWSCEVYADGSSYCEQ